ncbi:hypothetical protein AB6878_17530 [Carnobacterium maltaromaticum]|uniref:hypothetical protein n=1 Tax=Carnobacterium maltaromaticum TaxID=2751 RepID=UPI0039BE27AC
MGKVSKTFNEFFYAWGDNDPYKEVLRYGKMVTLKRLNEYDDYKYYRPRRKAAVVISGLVGVAGLIGIFSKKKR